MVVPARTARLGCRLAASALVLAVLCAPRTADAQSPRLEAAYVVLGPQGAVARAVLAQANECPAISIDGAQQVMSVRALPDAAFPVLVCERTIPAGASSASLENSPLPVPRPALKSIAAFGDTGCRLKSAKTAAKEGDTDDDDARGKFQDCNNPALWPFAQVAQSVADAKPDLVIHVGDYLYRESACPAGDAGCARSPYGDDWPTWKADFFAPAAPALRAAPWIVVRGNHEICRRAGPGYFRLLDPTPAQTSPAQTSPRRQDQEQSQRRDDRGPPRGLWPFRPPLRLRDARACGKRQGLGRHFSRHQQRKAVRLQNRRRTNRLRLEHQPGLTSLQWHVGIRGKHAGTRAPFPPPGCRPMDARVRPRRAARDTGDGRRACRKNAPLRAPDP